MSATVPPASCRLSLIALRSMVPVATGRHQQTHRSESAYC